MSELQQTPPSEATPLLSKHEFQWEAAVSPWKLFMRAAMTSGKILVSLLLLSYSLLSLRISASGMERISGKNPTIMPCNPTELSYLQVCFCEYTKAYLRAFPMLGISVTLAVSMRIMLQTRIYYGLLKCGGHVDFQNAQGWRDPVLLLLMVSLLHGTAHFALKLGDGRGESLKEALQMVQNFVAPCGVFMAFFYSSYDLESTLLPLSKFLEEDPETSQRALANLVLMEERLVAADVAAHDPVCGDFTQVDEVYASIIQRYPDTKRELADAEGIRGLRMTMWPAAVLLDPQLEDRGSRSFRGMFLLFLGVSCTVQALIFAYFAYQGLWKDLYNDVYLEGQRADAWSCLVLVVHAVAVGWVVLSTMRPVCHGAFGHRRPA